MGIYEMLDSFQEARGKPMGAPGTRPWIQGYPYLGNLPEGPVLPTELALNPADRKYPPRWGHEELRAALARYYQEIHGAKIGPQHVAVLGGGRQALFSLMVMHQCEMLRRGETSRVVLEQTEYPPYWDACRFLGLPIELIQSDLNNGFRPTAQDYASLFDERPTFWIKSNPCNPTGVTWSPDDLKPLIDATRNEHVFGLVDEAYEFFVDPTFRSALAGIDDIDAQQTVVVGAATKGLQFPGARIGWVVGPERLIDAIGSYVTFAVGGVSRPSQRFIEMLLDPEQVRHHRESMGRFNRSQSDQYKEMVLGAGMKVHTGPGGFYHWCEVPDEGDAQEVNQRLLEHDACVLPGYYCDQGRPYDESEYASPLARCFRLSFGPCGPEDPPGDARIWRSAFE